MVLRGRGSKTGFGRFSPGAAGELGGEEQGARS